MNEKIPSTRWLRIIVPVLIACIMSFMDRVNISFALPGGMEADLGITSQMAGVASGIFLLVIYFCKFPVGELRLTAAVKNLLPGRW
ncbi:major facilitator family transporter [Klebsiella variicola]|nr:major facilitator family transporter [Klebsiella variicola]